MELEEGRYFADYDEITGLYVVFDTAKDPWVAIGSYSSSEEAEEKARELNQEGRR